MSARQAFLLSLVCLAFAGLAAAMPAVVKREAPVEPRFKAVAFDFFVLFNPDTVVPDAERIFPGRGRELVNLWRTRQFEYTWLRSLTGRYVDFSTVSEDALVFATRAMHLDLKEPDKRRLLDAYLHLAPWPDAAGALARLKASGIRLITISNVSPSMLRANAEAAGLAGFFEALVSTDVIRGYKPEPRAYQLGADALHLAKTDIVFVAFGGWDAVGAKSFGYPTFWVNRFNQPLDELGLQPDQASNNLAGLLEFVLAPSRAE